MLGVEVTLSQHVCTTGTEPEAIFLEDPEWEEGLLCGLDGDGVRVLIPFTSIRYFHIHP